MIAEDVDMDLNVDPSDTLDFEPSKEVPQKIPTITTNSRRPNINIYSDKTMPLYIWEDVIGSYNWRGMPWHTHDQMMDVIIEDINDPTPKELTIACWGKHALTLDNDKILGTCRNILHLVKKSGIHKVSFATVDFPPNNQKLWPKLGKLNGELRILNIDRNIPPFPLHKALMKHLYENNKGPLIVKGNMWLEYCEGTGLGSTISKKGFWSIKNFAVRALKNQFTPMDRKPSNRRLMITQPPPLCTTDDYLTSPKMVEFMKNKGEYSIRSLSSNSQPTTRTEQPKRSASASNLDDQPESRPITPPQGFRPIVPQPGTVHSQGAAASAAPEERQIDLRDELNRRNRTGSWYSKDLTVKYQSDEQKREVVLPTKMDTEIEVLKVVDPKDQTNYNENDNTIDVTNRKTLYTTKNQWPYTTTKPKDDSNKNKNDDYNALKRDLKKAKQEIKKYKEREEFFDSKIKRLSGYSDNDEKEIKELKKELSELKSDNEKIKLEYEALKIQSKCDWSKLQSLEVTVEEQETKIKLLSDQYTFLKDIHDETTEMIKQQKEMKKKNKK